MGGERSHRRGTTPLTRPPRPHAAFAAALLEDWVDLHQHAGRLLQESRVLREQSATLRQVRQARHQQVLRNEAALFTDSVTGLMNRPGFRRALNAAIALSPPGGLVAVLFVDLDRFKGINDILGHEAGDAILRQVGPRLAGQLQPGDRVARLGGDEFAVALANPGNLAAVEAVVERLLAALREPFYLDGLAPRVDASIGVSLYPQHGATYDELLRHADWAMYAAKRASLGSMIYDPARAAEERKKLSLLGELEHALRRRELVLHYQPLLEIETGAVAGVEALVRWDRTDQVLPPDRFLPEAETTGIIDSIARLVLTDALGDLQGWHEARPNIALAVNLSMRNLLDTRLPADIKRMLDELMLPAPSLSVEITEGALIQDEERSVQVLRKLADLGVRIAVDDYGTGYSSLAYLRRLPVDTVKIDKSLISPIPASAVDTAIVDYTIKLAHKLDLLVVAEGVETAAAESTLLALGCDLVQGNRYSCPLPLAQLHDYLAAAPLGPPPAELAPTV